MNNKKKAPAFQSGVILIMPKKYKPKPKPPEVDLLSLWSSLSMLEETIRETKIKITEWISERT